MSQLHGKVAVILGAAGRENMGQTIARRFCAEGARVVIAGRDAGRPAGTGRRARVAWRSPATSPARPTSRPWRSGARESFGRIDIAVNCTGHGLMAKLRDTTEAQIDALTSLQFKGVFFFLQVFAEAMAQGGGGSIITMSSASVYALLYNHAAYIGTKAGADALVRCFANEYGARNVKVNALAPGLTSTPMTEKEMQMPGLREAFVKEYPLGRIGTAADVADAAAVARPAGQLHHRPGPAGQRRAHPAPQSQPPGHQCQSRGAPKSAPA